MRALTKEEVVSKFINDTDKKKYAAKRNEADCYLWNKGRMVGKKATKHRQRQPHWKSK